MYFKTNIIIIFILIIFSNQLKSQSVEYTFKASYIEKIARFTDWESSISGDYFVIGVLGESPFKGELEKMAKKMRIKDKTIKIKYFSNYENAKDCHLLFICASEKKNLPAIIKLIENFNILSISDTPGFGSKGVHYNFYIEKDQTIRFEINLAALKKAKLKSDMQLINVGKIIN